MVVTSYRRSLETKSDIQQHLGVLCGLAMQSKLVVEFGVRHGFSTSALCVAKAPVVSYDIVDCEPHASRLRKEHPHWKFIQASSLDVVIPQCDLLFIDSKHTYDQLFSELNKHHSSVRKWIVMHDTEKFGRVDYYGKKPGIMDAIEVFRSDNHATWKLLLHLPNNNGLTILQRIKW